MKNSANNKVPQITGWRLFKETWSLIKHNLGFLSLHLLFLSGFVCAFFYFYVEVLISTFIPIPVRMGYFLPRLILFALVLFSLTLFIPMVYLGARKDNRFLRFNFQGFLFHRCFVRLGYAFCLKVVFALLFWVLRALPLLLNLDHHVTDWLEKLSYLVPLVAIIVFLRLLPPFGGDRFGG